MWAIATGSSSLSENGDKIWKHSAAKLNSKLTNYNQLPLLYPVHQRVEGAERANIRGQNATLVLDSVTYAHQGNYVCVATNTIKGKERRMQSQPIQLEVVGEEMADTANVFQVYVNLLNKNY